MDRLLTGRPDSLPSLFQVLRAPPQYVLFVLNRLINNSNRSVSIFLDITFLLSLVGFKSHVRQLHGIDIQIAKGEFGCEFVGCFGVCPLLLLAVSVVVGILGLVCFLRVVTVLEECFVNLLKFHNFVRSSRF